MKRLLCLALMVLLLLSGCAQGTDVSAFAPGEEERLVIYTSHKEEVYGPIIKAVSYTHLDVYKRQF